VKISVPREVIETMIQEYNCPEEEAAKACPDARGHSEEMNFSLASEFKFFKTGG
jgi:hypothetical protein